jgi:hypothetical protein
MEGNEILLELSENSEKVSTSTVQSPPVSNRLAVLSIGLLANAIFNTYLFDFLLYPLVIWKLGVLKGGLVMTVPAGFFCYFLLRFYDWSKKDWLGIETLKSLKDYEGSNKIKKITAWFLRRSVPVVLVFLSVRFDAFITTLYLRRGSHQYNGLSSSDWKVFFFSLIVSNVYWTLASFMGVTVIEYLWLNFVKR